MTYPFTARFAQPSVVTPCPLRLIVPLSRQGSRPGTRRSAVGCHGFRSENWSNAKESI